MATQYEPYRYLSNARQILSEKAGKDGDFYSDPKYVRMASHTAYAGAILALTDWVKYQLKKPIYKREKGKKGVDVDFYRKHLAAHNRKMLKVFNSAYNTLHLSGGYDGTLVVGVIQSGLKHAEEIIDWVYYQVKDKLPHTGGSTLSDLSLGSIDDFVEQVGNYLY